MNTIISPANGKVVAVLKIDSDKFEIKKGLIGKIKTEYKLKEGYVVSIFMPLYVAHENIAPIAGKITNIEYKKGKFLSTFTLEKALYNEKNEITICNKELGEIKVIQIAGLIARRIRCYVKQGEEVKQGDKLGRILIGSQVTLILPKKVKVTAKLGDKVKCGKTIIGEY